MALQLVRTVVRKNLLLPPVRGLSREEAEYWLQMSKKQDVFPKENRKFSKLKHLDEFGPPLPPAVFRTGHTKDNIQTCDSMQHSVPSLSLVNMVEKKEKSVHRLVYYDLETTGLGFHNKHKDIEILEIGAVDAESKDTFSQYILPPGNHISCEASNVHSIYLREGALYRENEKLDAVDLKTGLESFLCWLKCFKQPITLAGYNNHEYDDWVICHNLAREGLSAAEDGAVVKFFDVSKIVRPYLKNKLGERKWNLTFAVKTCLGRSQSDAHSAVSDAVDSLDLMIKLGDEDVPEKAYKEAQSIENMCHRLAEELHLEEPKLTIAKIPQNHQNGRDEDISKHINDTPASDGEIFAPKNLFVSMLNQSRSTTLDVNMLQSKEIFKIVHIHNSAVPSVSRVLAATKSEESKAALARWEKGKIAVLGLEGFKEYKAEMFARGHTLHSMLETYMETKQLPKASDVPDSVSKRHLVSISQAVRQFDNPLVLESAVTHPELNYCGIVDCVAMVGDTLALVDWKTSEKVKNNAAALYDNPLQVAAYIGAINSDERYKRLGNLTKGAVVVVYNSGYPAMVHMFNTQQMEMYWEQWCQRLQMFQNMN